MQVSFLFSVRPAGGVHPWAGGVISVRPAGGVHPWAGGVICEIFGGPAVFVVLPRACWSGGASERSRPSAPPRDRRPDLVCCPLLFIKDLFIQVSFLFAFLTCFPRFFSQRLQPYPSPRTSPSFLVFDWRGAYIHGSEVLVCEIFGGPAVIPRACRSWASV